jgi:hypothetical protein
MSTVALAPAVPRPACPPATRRALVVLAWVAAGIHLVLTPEHFRERTVYGIFFLGASVFQVWLGWALLRRPSVRVFRVGAAGSLGLIATWIATRAVAPPLSPEGAPEPVTLAGVVATGAELAALVLLAAALPASGVRAWRARRAWAVAAGLAFALLSLLASSAVSYVPWVAKKVPSFNDITGDIRLDRPFIIGMPVPHIWVVGPWSTFALTALAAVLVAANVAVAMDPRRGDAAWTRRRTLLGAAPAFLAVSSCCGAPVALFLGVSATVALARASPWLLAGTVAMFALNLALVRARGRAGRPRSARACGGDGPAGGA